MTQSLSAKPTAASPELTEQEWVTFPGGELQGKRPSVRVSSGCPSCRAGALCFQCYRASLAREERLRAAGQLDTASLERFQGLLPLEPVDRPRLDHLRAVRQVSRSALATGMEHYALRVRRAQMAARRAIEQIAHARMGVTPTSTVASDTLDVEQRRALARAVDAAELQLPESWLPFVVSL